MPWPHKLLERVENQVIELQILNMRLPRVHLISLSVAILFCGCNLNVFSGKSFSEGRTRANMCDHKNLENETDFFL